MLKGMPIHILAATAAAIARPGFSSQSRGSFTLHFVRYEECPGPAQEKAIAAAKAMAEE